MDLSYILEYIFHVTFTTFFFLSFFFKLSKTYVIFPKSIKMFTVSFQSDADHTTLHELSHNNSIKHFDFNGLATKSLTSTT